MQLKQDASSRMQDQWNSSRRILCSSQSQFALRNSPLTKPMRNFALPKFAMNFAMPISQCQIQFRNAKFNFAMPIHCSFVSQSKPLRNFALRNSQTTLRKFANPFRIANFTAFAKFTLRNLQALSSFVINVEPPSNFGVLLFCPIT